MPDALATALIVLVALWGLLTLLAGVWSLWADWSLERHEEDDRREAHPSVAAMRRERRQEFEARENCKPHVDVDVTVEPPAREAA